MDFKEAERDRFAGIRRRFRGFVPESTGVPARVERRFRSQNIFQFTPFDERDVLVVPWQPGNMPSVFVEDVEILRANEIVALERR